MTDATWRYWTPPPQVLEQSDQGPGCQVSGDPDTENRTRDTWQTCHHSEAFIKFEFGQNIIKKIYNLSHEQFQSYFVYVGDVSSFSSLGFFVSSFSFFPSWREAYQPTKILYFIAMLFAVLINTNVGIYTKREKCFQSFLVSNISKAAMLQQKE